MGYLELIRRPGRMIRAARCTITIARTLAMGAHVLVPVLSLRSKGVLKRLPALDRLHF